MLNTKTKNIIKGMASILSIIDSSTDKVIVLNTTGAAIWNLFDGSTSCSQIITKVASQFSASEDQISEEVFTLIESLVAKNLILEKKQ